MDSGTLTKVAAWATHSTSRISAAARCARKVFSASGCKVDGAPMARAGSMRERTSATQPHTNDSTQRVR